jgi:hypothetical protein
MRPVGDAQSCGPRAGSGPRRFRVPRPAAVTTALALVCELFRDWAGPLGDAGRELAAWHFNEVPKLTPEVGILPAERVRAEDQGARDVIAA